MVDVKFMNGTPASETVSKRLLHVFRTIFKTGRDEYGRIRINRNDAVLRDIITKSDAFIMKSQGSFDDIKNDLFDYFESILRAIENPYFLIRFDMYGEFFLNETVKFYNRNRKNGQDKCVVTDAERNKLYACCEKMTGCMPREELPEGEMDSIVSDYFDSLTDIRKMERVYNGGVLDNPFYYAKEPIVLWNVDAGFIPEFGVISSRFNPQS